MIFRQLFDSGQRIGHLQLHPRQPKKRVPPHYVCFGSTNRTRATRLLAEREAYRHEPISLA